MKKILNGWLFLAATLTGIFFATCTPEEGPLPSSGPTLTFVSESGFLTSSATVSAGEVFKVKIRATKGDAALKTLTVYEDGVKITDYATRITFDGAAAVANPILILGADKDGFTKEVTIVAHQGAFTHTYEFRVDDEGSLSDSESLDISTTSGPLAIQFVETSPYFWTDASLEAGSIFQVKVIANRGAHPMDKLTVFGNGAALDASRIQINGSAASANPVLLSGADQSGIEWVISIKSHDSSAKETLEYKVEVEDHNGDKVSVKLNITTGLTTLMGMLLNQAGPTSTGGLNLLTGVGVGSTDPSAHIRDMGIDIGQPLDKNWLQQIAGANGSVLKTPAAGATITFADIKTSSAIRDLFDAGTEVAISPKVTLGKYFLVKNGDNYFLLYTSEVLITPSNNSDHYKFDVKY